MSTESSRNQLSVLQRASEVSCIGGAAGPEEQSFTTLSGGVNACAGLQFRTVFYAVIT